MILVLADDFSGAAEIAGAALQHSLSAEVHVDQLFHSDADVVVVDTDTRPLNDQAAASTIARVAQQLSSTRPAWIFKKVDSVLRGPIVAELDALSRALSGALRPTAGRPRCILVNANPRKERIVAGGQLLVGGQPIAQTQFAFDPEHPATTSSVLELLGGDRGGQLQLLSSPAELEQLADASPSAAWLYIGNCADAGLLAGYAQGIDARMLPAGGAEFFEALLSARGYQTRTDATSSLTRQPGTLLVRGTSMPPTTTAAAKKPGDARPGDGRPSDAGMPATVQATADPRQAATEVCRQLQIGDLVMLVAAAAAARNRAHPSGQADVLHRQLVETVRQVANQCPLGQLWIEGGRTASSIVRALGWQRLEARAVYADGVVGLSGKAAPTPLVVVKPGSYRWPE